MSRYKLQTVGLVNDADGIHVSSSPGAGTISLDGALVSGGVAYIYDSTNDKRYSNRMGQIVTITSGGNDSGITFTVTGKDANGADLSETITGANIGSAVTTKYFSEVSSVTKSGASAGTIVIGVLSANGGVTRTYPMNARSQNFAVGLGLVVSGTITCTVQHTFDDIQDATVTKTWIDHATLVSKTANTDGNYAFRVEGVRLKVVPNSTTDTAYLQIIGS